MNIFGLIPVKPFRLGKSRLAGVLTDEERVRLNQALLVHTLKALSDVPDIKCFWVVSRDPNVLALARRYQARTILESGNAQLNSALHQATASAQLSSSDGVLILPADLPLLTSQDIRNILSKSSKPPVIVINPDRHRMGTMGTNALLMCPIGIIDYAFGVDSFHNHCCQAMNLHITLEIISLPSISLDLDLPEDLDYLQQSKLDQIGLFTDNNRCNHQPS
jgi:2-phospho-L-lactate guanylyltransferase